MIFLGMCIELYFQYTCQVSKNVNVNAKSQQCDIVLVFKTYIIYNIIK